jgi:hypothetical protein
MGWQPIETAPRDGTPIDIWGEVGNHADEEDGRITDAYWHAGLKGFVFWCQELEYGDGALQFIKSPTHWMPLPNPPISFSFDDQNDPWNEALQRAEECIVGLAKTLGENERDKALWEAVDAVRSNKRGWCG